jgi:HSP20 family molecular chaperone IbpA
MSSPRAFLFGLIYGGIHEDVNVIAELPGVQNTDIELTATEDSLTISINNPGHQYFKEAKLPARVDPQRAKSNCKNGILEASIPKKDGEK